MTKQELILEISEKYGEWLDPTGEGQVVPSLMIDVMAGLLLKEMALSEHYKKVSESLQCVGALNS